MGIQDGAERSFREGQDWVNDTLALKDLAPLLPEFKTLTDVDKFCDEKMPEFEALGEKEVMGDPKRVNVMVLEASSFLHQAQEALQKIHASGLRFSLSYCKPYKDKLDRALRKFNDFRLRLFDQAVAMLDGILFSGFIKKTYDLDERDMAALKALKANLEQFHVDLEGFKVDFDSIIVAQQHDPCNNKILSEFMYEYKHVDFFRAAYETIVEAKSIEEMDWKERYEFAMKLKKDWDEREKIQKQEDEEEADQLLVQMEKEAKKELGEEG